MGRWFSLSLTLRVRLHRIRRCRTNKPQSIVKPADSHTRRRRRRRRRGHQHRSVNGGMDEVEEEQQVSNKRKLSDIELNSVLDAGDDDILPPRELEVVPATKDDNLELYLGLGDEFCSSSDADLEEKIKRSKKNLNVLPMADNGAKLRLLIKRMEAECERRKRDKDAYMHEIKSHSKALNLSGDQPTGILLQMCQKSAHPALKMSDAASGLHQGTPLSNGKTHSLFFSEFSAKLEQSDSRATGSCNQPKRISNGQLVSKREQTSRDQPFQCPTRMASNKTSYTPVNCEKRGNFSGSLHLQKSLPSRRIQKARALPNLNTVRGRRRQEDTVVLLDDEDSEFDDDDLHFDDMRRHFGNLKDQGSRISYPSRDDPTHVDIDFFDVKCLDPEVYLSSPIMNFYIRYLQQPGSHIDKSRCAFHFFNTFFFSKLKAAVSEKGSDSTSFAKFRRWWKGINLFHKAYILIPVHEDQHWSLIIICIPVKGKETGPVILHLDSLELHNSRPIFENIKRFIREEWEYLTHEGASSNLPWENYPRRIEQKTVTVPQQKNEYDCGLFVLYFMERFIAEAPDRLSRRDLQMFSRLWFRPSEASALRKKIRRLLIKEFKTAQQQTSDTGPNQT